MDGILVVSKPIGPTSHDIVAIVRRLAATKRVGHGGTLDPFATGVLPLFLGRATRMLEYHLDDPKAYRATICFGASSTTDDLQGELTPGEGPPPTRAAAEEALSPFRGSIVQVPPAYSAVKVAGRRAYALARSGESPELAPRTVTVQRLEIVEWDEGDPDRPIAIVEVACSAGTYVRAIARDLGRALGVGAYLGALTRTASGPFLLEDAHTLDDVRSAAAGGTEGLAALLLRPDTGLEGLPAITLDAPDLDAIARGQFIRPAAGSAPASSDGPLRLLDQDGRLVAMGALRAGRIAPSKVFVDAPVDPDRQRLEDEMRAERDPSESIDADVPSADDA